MHNWVLLDCSLMIGWRKIWRKKTLKPWKGVLCFHFHVSPSVRPRATEHTIWPRNLVFWIEGPLGYEKEIHFFCFSKFWKMTIVGSFLLLFYPFLYHYLCCHITGITVFGLFDWYQFPYHLSWNGWCSST